MSCSVFHSVAGLWEKAMETELQFLHTGFGRARRCWGDASKGVHQRHRIRGGQGGRRGAAGTLWGPG